MAFEQPGMIITRETGDDQTAGAFKFVKLNSSGQLIAMAANTDKPFGILQDNAATSAAGNMVPVMLYGVSKVIAGADLSKGDQIGSSSTGLAATYVPGTDTTKYIVGEVLLDNSVANGYASVAFNCLGAGRGA